MPGTKGRVVALVLVGACASGQGRDDEGTLPSTGATTTSETGDGTTTGEPTSTTSTGAPSTDTGDATTSTGTTTTTTGALTGPDSETADATGPVAGCGDGVVQAPELCDDGNLVDGDGCNVDCRPAAEVLWSTTHGGMLGLADEALGCAVDGNNSIYVIGFVGVGADDTDWWIRKYAADGAELWTQSYAGSAMLADQGRAIVVDAAETVYVAGLAQEPMEGNDLVVRKHAADGSPLWTRKFAGAAMLNDVASGAVLTPDGGLLVGGATAVADAGNDTWLRKYASTGDVLWTRTYDGAAGSNDATQAVAVTEDGYIYAAGYEAAPGESNNMWIARYDADGNLLWSRLYNGADSKADYLYGVVAMDDGGVVVCGYETAESVPWKSFVRRYDVDGLTVWTEVEAGPEAAGALCYGLSRADDGDLLFAGATIVAGQREPWLRRLAPDGTPRWSTPIAGAGAGSSHARCLQQAPDGTLVAAGGVDGGVDGRDVWVARLSP
ncbi:hypothetical protein [Nannocystis radixulma]|uniref:Myxococcus cysteine-rich repeat-containing protein n=1 Tax=Nannocystis radixulma TaxID=2995305 RepID=A0ABT5BI16_9BACT|nr:hypothetical protein [Nannocystis radixulma]MDC0672682.1 hypothetical protein [Nannocystis radixulma]